MVSDYKIIVDKKENVSILTHSPNGMFLFYYHLFTVDNSKYVYGKTCDLSDDDVYSFYGLKYIRLVTSIKLK